MPGQRQVLVFSDLPALAAAAAAHCLARAGRAIAARGVFHVALSGGSTPRSLYERLAAAPQAADWSRWHVWFGDERCVPQDHPASNFRMARETLLERVPLPAAQIHPMYESGDARDAAAAYAASLDARLPQENGIPVLDLVLLGMGEDGHTASLFPGCPAVNERHALTATCIAPNGSPRITLTPPVIEAARAAIVLVSGAAKAGTLARVLSGEARDLPVARLVPRGENTWFVDRAAMGGGRSP